jgi:hypothetical protein
VLQSQGLAKYAPPTLPDEQSLQMLVNQTVPVQDQYKMGLITAPGLTDALARSNAPLPGQPGYGGTTGTTPGSVATTPSATIEPAAFNNATAVRDGLIKRGIDPDTATALAANALHESVANPATGRGDNGNSAGLFQWAGPRLQAYTDAYGHSPDGSPLDEQLDNVVRELKGSEAPAAAKIAEAQGPAAKAAAVSQYYLRPKDTQAEMQRRSATALQLQQQIGGGTTTASAAPAGGRGTPSYQVASNAPVAPPGPTAAPGGPPAAPQFTYPNGKVGDAPDAQGGVHYADGNYGTPPPGPRVPVAAAAPASTPAQPGQPQPAAAPAATAQPAPSTGTGTQSPQFQAALEMNRRATALETQFPYSPQAKAQAASLRAQAALYMQADSVSVDPVTGIQTKQLTGERLNAAAPNAHYVWNEQQGAYVDTTGVHPPVTPPSPRMTMVPGVGAVQSKPGGGATVVVPMNPAGITEQEAAKTSGAAAGTATGKLTGELADQGRTAASAIGNIDYGMSQVAKAKTGGINTGYFAPWLSTVASVAKSLGVPTEAIGVDPNAVGNIQTAKKTLAVVSGAILQQILGPGSQVTDAKIQHFIAAQPGIETDPAALERVLNWARSQFVYEREMAAKGMEDASVTGVLPPNWQAKYYHEHGFAPIYNPGTGEMQQPDGQAPSREPPASTASAPKAVAPPAVGTIKGGYRFKGGDPASQANWERVQ